MPSLTTEGAKEALNNLEITFIEGPHHVRSLTAWITQNADVGRAHGVDTETTGLDPRKHRVRLIQVATKESVLIVDLDGFLSLIHI